ncbi:MAG: L-histidine N(alpha)-methyltransferase [Deltaproteobacteria bacterium]|nr:L-histidine N(alpha)-methyltransferase [Deltaproteobacteria bacterium]
MAPAELRSLAPRGAAADDARREFAADVRRDLQLRPRQLQAKYFYDALGSQLFEAICQLPWYRIPSAERALLAGHAETIGGLLPDLTTIVELGCGSGAKLALLVERMRRARPMLVRLVDVSATALELSARTLGRLSEVSVVGHRAPFGPGLRDAVARRPAQGSMLVLFLGSNIGNFHPTSAIAFLREVRDCLRPGDGFLLGADLVKPEQDLLLAYGDPIGVTAAFNKNLLDRINRELGGDFDLAAFDHVPRWNAELFRMESHLVSRRDQIVRVALADLVVALRAGESIWTESSYKYEPGGLVAMARAAGLVCRGQWIEPSARFALSLFGV